ncbi:MAG TPA: serine protease [Myxococcaceae bacterium]|nr:serine protease [Myxococcaceae bacterium]
MPPWAMRSLLLPALLLLSCGDCSSNNSNQQAERSVHAVQDHPAYAPLHFPLAEEAGAEFQPFNTRLFQQAGEQDLKNRYSSTVMISLNAPMSGARCSGVLLGARLALTSGSCVCGGKRAASNEVACAARVYVKTIQYGETRGEPVMDMEIRPYMGTIRPHPELKFIQDERPSVVPGTADLAVVVLDTPVTPSPAEVLLGHEALQPGELITMVGYGYGDEVGQIFGHRYFRKNQITKLLPEGRALYEQQWPFLYNGFHGGPCFREEENGRWLVGIASLGTADELTVASTHFHQKWILAEIERVSGETTSGSEHRSP